MSPVLREGSGRPAGLRREPTQKWGETLNRASLSRVPGIVTLCPLQVTTANLRCPKQKGNVFKECRGVSGNCGVREEPGLRRRRAKASLGLSWESPQVVANQ